MFVPLDDFDNDPLCIIPLDLAQEVNIFDWVLLKVDELKNYVEIFCVGFEEQFCALLVAIETSQPFLTCLASSKERKLKRTSSINDDGKGDSILKNEGTKRVVFCFK